MMERLRADQAMEAEEKARLEEEINAKAEEVAEIQNAVNSKFLSFFTKIVVNSYQIQSYTYISSRPNPKCYKHLKKGAPQSKKKKRIFKLI